MKRFILILIILFINFTNSAYAKETYSLFGVKVNSKLDKSLVIQEIPTDECFFCTENTYEIKKYEILKPKKDLLSSFFDNFYIRTINFKGNEIIVEVQGISNNCNNVFKLKKEMERIDLSNERISVISPIFDTAEHSIYNLKDSQGNESFELEHVCSDYNENTNLIMYLTVAQDYFFKLQ